MAFRDFNVIKKLSTPLVPIICSVIGLAALEPCDAIGKEKEWITLDNCKLVPNKSNDGDSFHVQANALGTGVEGVLEQLLDHGRRPLHHLTGSDLVGHIVRENVDAPHEVIVNGVAHSP